MIHLKHSQLTVLCVLDCTNLHRWSFDIIHTNNEHVEKLQDEVYELIQKLKLYRDFLAKFSPVI